MKCDLDLQLLSGQAAVSQGMFLVDELDGDDGVRGMKWSSFANSESNMVSLVCSAT